MLGIGFALIFEYAKLQSIGKIFPAHGDILQLPFGFMSTNIYKLKTVAHCHSLYYVHISFFMAVMLSCKVALEIDSTEAISGIIT